MTVPDKHKRVVMPIKTPRDNEWYLPLSSWSSVFPVNLVKHTVHRLIPVLSQRFFFAPNGSLDRSFSLDVGLNSPSSVLLPLDPTRESSATLGSRERVMGEFDNPVINRLERVRVDEG